MKKILAIIFLYIMVVTAIIGLLYCISKHANADGCINCLSDEEIEEMLEEPTQEITETPIRRCIKKQRIEDVGLTAEIINKVDINGRQVGLAAMFTLGILSVVYRIFKKKE